MNFLYCVLVHTSLKLIVFHILKSSNVYAVVEMSVAATQSKDASDVTWAHAVNSRNKLKDALDSSVDFLEADISLGYVTGNIYKIPIPIMAHPPNENSDISLDSWLNTVHDSGKGLKLDFKSIEVVEPSLKILEKYASQLNSSVWLNADVLPGPVKSPTLPVNVEQFLTKCHQYFPKAILSIGWTTYWFPAISTPETWHYEWQHIRAMADVIRCNKSEKRYATYTFPVRGIFASRSIQLLQWLLSISPGSSITVWSHKLDPLTVQDLLRIRSSFPKERVYYDVPKKIHALFQKEKNSVAIPNADLMVNSDQWLTLTQGNGNSCTTLTYANNEMIVFGSSVTTAVLRRKLFVLQKENNLKISGRIKFFYVDRELSSYSYPIAQKLMLVLANVSLFSRNTSQNSQNELDLTTSDTEIIWSALNSSVIFTFQHNYPLRESCRAFKLEMTADKPFEVWTMSYDTSIQEKSLEELAETGISENFSIKGFVLPEGTFMFGLVSKLEGHVVLHDLTIQESKSLISGSSQIFETTLTVFVTFLTVFLGLISLL